MIRPLTVRSSASMRGHPRAWDGWFDRSETPSGGQLTPASTRPFRREKSPSLRFFDAGDIQRLAWILNQLCLRDRLLHRGDLEGDVRDVEPLVIPEAGFLVGER